MRVNRRCYFGCHHRNDELVKFPSHKDNRNIFSQWVKLLQPDDQLCGNNFIENNFWFCIRHFEFTRGPVLTRHVIPTKFLVHRHKQNTATNLKNSMKNYNSILKQAANNFQHKSSEAEVTDEPVVMIIENDNSTYEADQYVQILDVGASVEINDNIIGRELKSNRQVQTAVQNELQEFLCFSKPMEPEAVLELVNETVETVPNDHCENVEMVPGGSDDDDDDESILGFPSNNEENEHVPLPVKKGGQTLYISRMEFCKEWLKYSEATGFEQDRRLLDFIVSKVGLDAVSDSREILKLIISHYSFQISNMWVESEKDEEVFYNENSDWLTGPPIKFRLSAPRPETQNLYKHINPQQSILNQMQKRKKKLLRLSLEKNGDIFKFLQKSVPPFRWGLLFTIISGIAKDLNEETRTKLSEFCKRYVWDMRFKWVTANKDAALFRAKFDYWLKLDIRWPAFLKAIFDARRTSAQKESTENKPNNPDNKLALIDDINQLGEALMQKCSEAGLENVSKAVHRLLHHPEEAALSGAFISVDCSCENEIKTEIVDEDPLMMDTDDTALAIEKPCFPPPDKNLRTYEPPSEACRTRLKQTLQMLKATNTEPHKVDLTDDREENVRTNRRKTREPTESRENSIERIDIRGNPRELIRSRENAKEPTEKIVKDIEGPVHSKAKRTGPTDNIAKDIEGPVHSRAKRTGPTETIAKDIEGPVHSRAKRTGPTENIAKDFEGPVHSRAKRTGPTETIAKDFEGPVHSRAKRTGPTENIAKDIEGPVHSRAKRTGPTENIAKDIEVPVHSRAKKTGPTDNIAKDIEGPVHSRAKRTGPTENIAKDIEGPVHSRAKRTGPTENIAKDIEGPVHSRAKRTGPTENIAKDFEGPVHSRAKRTGPTETIAKDFEGPVHSRAKRTGPTENIAKDIEGPVHSRAKRTGPTENIAKDIEVPVHSRAKKTGPTDNIAKDIEGPVHSRAKRTGPTENIAKDIEVPVHSREKSTEPQTTISIVKDLEFGPVLHKILFIKSRNIKNGTRVKLNNRECIAMSVSNFENGTVIVPSYKIERGAKVIRPNFKRRKAAHVVSPNSSNIRKHKHTTEQILSSVKSKPVVQKLVADIRSETETLSNGRGNPVNVNDEGTRALSAINSNTGVPHSKLSISASLLKPNVNRQKVQFQPITGSEVLKSNLKTIQHGGKVLIGSRVTSLPNNISSAVQSQSNNNSGKLQPLTIGGKVVLRPSIADGKVVLKPTITAVNVELQSYIGSGVKKQPYIGSGVKSQPSIIGSRVQSQPNIGSNVKLQPTIVNGKVQLQPVLSQLPLAPPPLEPIDK